MGYQALGGVAVLADNTWSAMQGRKEIEGGVGRRARTAITTRRRTKRNCRKPRASPEKWCAKTATWMRRLPRAEKSWKQNIMRRCWRTLPWSRPRRWRFFADGKLEVWAPTQNPQGAREAIAGALGLKKEDVTVNVTLLGGAFGRKSFPDFAVEAAVLAKKTGKPVKVVWSREDDIKFDTYHSVSAMYMKASLGADGKPTAWLQRTVFPPIGSTFDAKTVYSDPGRAGAGLHRFAICFAESSIGERPGDGTCAHRVVPLGGQHLSRICDPVVLRTSWRMPREKIRWNIRWRFWGQIALSRSPSCPRITRTTAGITSNIPSIRRDSGGWCNWRRRNRVGENETGQWRRHGHRHAPQLFDVCRDGGDHARGRRRPRAHRSRGYQALDAGTVVNPEMVRQPI